MGKCGCRLIFFTDACSVLAWRGLATSWHSLLSGIGLVPSASGFHYSTLVYNVYTLAATPDRLWLLLAGLLLLLVLLYVTISWCCCVLLSAAAVVYLHQLQLG